MDDDSVRCDYCHAPIDADAPFYTEAFDGLYEYLEPFEEWVFLNLHYGCVLAFIYRPRR
jgi:hypothetical protein